MRTSSLTALAMAGTALAQFMGATAAWGQTTADTDAKGSTGLQESW